jgi:hypothetical protein
MEHISPMEESVNADYAAVRGQVTFTFDRNHVRAESSRLDWRRLAWRPIAAQVTGAKLQIVHRGTSISADVFASSVRAFHSAPRMGKIFPNGEEIRFADTSHAIDCASRCVAASIARLPVASFGTRVVAEDHCKPALF